MHIFGKLSKELSLQHSKYFSDFKPSYFSLQEGASTSVSYLSSILFGDEHQADAFVIVDNDDRRIDCLVVIFRPRKLYGDAYFSLLLPDRKISDLNGMASCIIELLEDFAKASNIRKMRSDIAAFEKEAERILLAMGFENEGRLRQQLLHHGRYIDSLIYSKDFKKGK